MSTEYQIGAGNIHVAKLNSSFAPLAFRDVGEAPVFEWDPTVDFADNFVSNKTAPNTQDLHIAIKKTAMVNLTLTERTALNLELFLFGESTPDAAGSYTANAPFSSSTIANGETYEVPGDHVGITSLVIKDSAGTPVTVNASKYSVNADANLVTFLDVAGFTQPFTAFSYSYVKSDKLTILSKAVGDLCVMFDGVNLAVPGERLWAKIDRVAFGPCAKFAGKSGSSGGTGNERAQYELTGPALIVPGRTGYGLFKFY